MTASGDGTVTVSINGLHCPLCDYNLHGLVEPRCPECGYRFEWDGLRDQARRRHPYLFEQYPKRNVWSFFRTLRGTLFPKKFWTTLQPDQPGDGARLMLYWVCSLLLVGWIAILGFAWHTYRLDQMARAQAKIASASLRAAVATRGPGALGPYPSIATAVDARFPTLPDKRFLRLAWVRFLRQPWNGRIDFLGFKSWLPNESLLNATIWATLLYALWPWLSIAVLLIFQASMRRARIQAIHVLRCVIYSCDATWLVAVSCGVCLPYLIPRTFLWQFCDVRFTMVAGSVLALFTAWRLSRAYALYLRFDRTILTTFASQLIVWLFVLTACSVRLNF